jgi:hypothetical protein
MHSIAVMFVRLTAAPRYFRRSLIGTRQYCERTQDTQQNACLVHIVDIFLKNCGIAQLFTDEGEPSNIFIIAVTAVSRGLSHGSCGKFICALHVVVQMLVCEDHQILTGSYALPQVV